MPFLVAIHPIAENYNLEANFDDGSCEYIFDALTILQIIFHQLPLKTMVLVNTLVIIMFPCFVIDCYGEEISWDLTNDNGVTIVKFLRAHTLGAVPQIQWKREEALNNKKYVMAIGTHLPYLTATVMAWGSEFSCGIDEHFLHTDQNGEILFEENNPVFGDVRLVVKMTMFRILFILCCRRTCFRLYRSISL